MSLWQSLRNVISKTEDVIDGVARPVRRWLYRNTDVTILPYIGYGNPLKVRLRGRVVENHTVQAARDEDNAARNLLNVIRRFNSDELPGVEITAAFGGQQKQVVTDEEGFYFVEFDLPEPIVGIHHTAQFYFSGDRRQATATGEVIVVPDSAQFAVVSDMDDTVIHSNVPNRIKLLANTLFKNARTRLPFPGVAQFYQALQTGTSNTFNPIYYVSNSPYNLHDLLQDFSRVREIPLGPIFLRDFGLTQRYLGASASHKSRQIKHLLKFHPELPFILIGDSGEHDAEIYAEIVQQYPGRIAAIYIRDVRPLQNRIAKQRIHEIARATRQQGVDMLLISDTLEAVKHAVANGFVSASSIQTVAAAL